jgi:hypothetical protein
MSKLKNVMVALVALSVFTVMPALAAGTATAGCLNFKFVGSYTHADEFADVWGDGTNVAHWFLFQLNLHSDGTASQHWTGFSDIMLSAGTGSPFVGSWKCRGDGKLVVTVITASYLPTGDAINHPTTVPDPPPVDTFLTFHARTTYLFSVTDGNTLTRIQRRTRLYPADEDPSDPTGGTLGPLNTDVVVYKRLVASDADLLAP